MTGDFWYEFVFVGVCTYSVSQNLCHKLFLGIPHLSEQVPRYRLTLMCWYPFEYYIRCSKMLTICLNTSVETSHHGFPDAFQLIWSVPDGIKCSCDAFP